MVDMVYKLSKAATGTNICELPLTPTSPIQFGMNEVGQWSATMPADHPSATLANFDGVVEVTVYRDGQAEMNGPVGELDVSSDDRTVNLTIYEASAYFGMRTIEVDKHYDKDRFAIVRSLFTEITTKTSTSGDGTSAAGSNINADLPRFSVMAGDSGFTMDLSLSGIARHTFTEALEKLIDDPTEGIEWCMDYRTSSRAEARRVLMLGAPLGTTLPQSLVAQVLASYGKTYDTTRAATRAHARGRGLTVTKQNVSSIADGTLLLEQSVDVDTANSTRLSSSAKELRRKSQPPVWMPRFSYHPSSSLPFGWCGLGDTIPMNIDDPSADLLTLSGHNRRIVSLEWTPESGDEPESVTAVLNVPLDELGV